MPRHPSARLARTVASCAVLLLALSCGKDGPTDPIDGGFEPTQGTSLVLSDASTAPLQAITGTVRGATLPTSGIVARLGDVTLPVDRLDDSTLVFMPPVMAAAQYPLQVEFADTRLAATLVIQAPAVTVAPDQYIASAFDVLDSIAMANAGGDEPMVLAVQAQLADARAQLLAASPDERAAAAAFLAANAPALGLSIPGGPAAEMANIIANASAVCSCSRDGSAASRFEACNLQLGSFLTNTKRKAIIAASIIIAARALDKTPTAPTLIAGVAAVSVTAAVLTNLHTEAWCKFVDPAFDKLATDDIFEVRAEGDSARPAARQANLAAPGGTIAHARAAGTFIADTARRLDVYGTYSTPSLELASRNGLVADAVASMQEFGRVWDIVKAVVPILADFGTIPQTSASSAQHLVHPEYLVLTNGTPFPDLAMSSEAEDDTTFMVTFDLPGIGNDHAITFDVEYVGPGMLVDQVASYTGSLQPRPYPVARITLEPSAPMIDVETDHSVSMTATLYDSLDRVITDDRVIAWTSSQPSVATVSGAGRVATVYGVREGLSTIRITAETKSADFIIKVGPMPVDTVDIIPDTVSIGVGGTFELEAQTRDSLGNILNGRLVEWSSSNTDHVTVSATGVIEGVGLGEATITAVSEGKSNTAFVRVIAGAVALGTGAAANHQCAIATGGALFCWGSNSDGQLGDGTATDRNVPTYASAVPSGMVQVVTGLEHSCALDGEGVATCWGANDLGQLGDGTISGAKIAPVTGGHVFTKLAIGKATTCGIATNGTTYCWGQRVTGTATTTEQPTPAAVSGSYVDLVGAPHGGMCGLTAGGAMYCWGSIGWGQTAASQFPVSPTRFGGTMTFSAITAGHHHQCGISGGTAYCWGSQMDGVVGDTLGYFDPETGEIGDVRVPVRVYNAPSLVSLTAGDDWTCGLTSAGAAWCWAGIGGTPVLVGGPADNILPTRGAIQNAASLRFTQLSAGRNTACGMDSGGIVYCWGENTSGQAGQGTFTPLPGAIPPRPVEDPVTP